MKLKNLTKALPKLPKLFLIAVFCLSALGKLTRPSQFYAFLNGVSWIPSALHFWLFLGLVCIETALAVLLIFKKTAHAGALASFALLLSFTVVLILASSSGQHLACGCFGEIIGGTSLDFSILRNLGLLLLTMLVLISSSNVSPEER